MPNVICLWLLSEPGLLPGSWCFIWRIGKTHTEKKCEAPKKFYCEQRASTCWVCTMKRGSRHPEGESTHQPWLLFGTFHYGVQGKEAVVVKRVVWVFSVWLTGKLYQLFFIAHVLSYDASDINCTLAQLCKVVDAQWNSPEKLTQRTYLDLLRMHPNQPRLDPGSILPYV